MFYLCESINTKSVRIKILQPQDIAQKKTFLFFSLLCRSEYLVIYIEKIDKNVDIRMEKKLIEPKLYLY